MQQGKIWSCLARFLVTLLFLFSLAVPLGATDLPADTNAQPPDGVGTQDAQNAKSGQQKGIASSESALAPSKKKALTERSCGPFPAEAESAHTKEGLDRLRVEPRYRTTTARGGPLQSPLPAAEEQKGQPLKVYDYAPIEASTVVVSDLPPVEKPPEIIVAPDEHRLPQEVQDRLRNRPPDTSVHVQDASSPETPAGRLQPGSTFFDIQLPQDGAQPAAPPAAKTVSFRDGGTCDLGYVPPDVDMAVGPNHIFTDYNAAFQIRDKTGVLIQAFTAYSSLFSGMPNCASTTSLTDPQTVYDDENDRWVTLIARIANTGTLCLAASQTGDPTGTWNRYEITAPTNRFPDYAKLAIGEDAIFIGANNFNGSTFDQGMVWAIQKTAAYSGGAITPRSIGLGGTAYTPVPAERRGFAQGHYPPAGSPHYWSVTSLSTGGAEIWRWTQPTFTTGTMTWWGNGPGYLGGTNTMNGTFTTKPIDGGVIGFHDIEYSNGRVAICRTQPNSTFDGIQWAEFDVSGGTLTMLNSGLYTIASKFLTWPDVTIDASNNLAVGFTLAAENGGNPDDFPGAWITGREDGITPANTLEAAVVSKAGTAQFQTTETSATARWGDYQGVTLDPNGCDLWFNGMYSETGCSVRSSMWVRNFKFPSCSTANDLALDKTRYLCKDSLTVTVDDATAISASDCQTYVILTSASDSESIPAASWTCTGGCSGSTGTQWQATIPVSDVAGSSNDGTLNVTDGDTITATYNDPHVGHPNINKTSTVDCTVEACYYLVDDLTGGCDNDKYHDEGEVLTYDVGIANFDTLNTGMFYADLRVKAGTDPNGYIQIVNATALYDDLAPNFYEYANIPFKVRYNGPIASTCGAKLEFEVYNIRATDGSWTSGGCFIDPGAFSFIANLDPAAPTAKTTYDFGSTLQGWTSVNAHGTTTPECAGGTGGCPAGGSYSNGTWVRSTTRHRGALGDGSAYIDHTGLTCSDKGLLSPTLDFAANNISQVGFWYWADTDIYDASYTWDGVILEASADDGVTWSQVTLTPTYPSRIANYQCNYDPPFPNYGGNGNTPMLAGDGTGTTYTNDQFNQEMIGDLSAFATSSTVRLRFRSGSDDTAGAEGVYIDDVVLYSAVQCETSVCTPSPDLQYSGQFAFDDSGCNNDGAIDPGELGVLQLYIDNLGNDDALSVTGTLASNTTGVSVCDSTAAYGYVPFDSSYVYGAASDTFSIAVDGTVACGTIASLDLTLQGTDSASNSYGPVVRTVSVPIGKSTEVLRYEDHFLQDTDGTAATGRVGFANPGWTDSSDARVIGNFTATSSCASSDGDGKIVQIRRGNNFRRTFSTVGATYGLTVSFELQSDGLDTGESGFAEFTTNGGTSWTTIRSVTGDGTTQGWVCYTVDLVSEFGSAVLDNANFGIRFRSTGNVNADHFNVDDFQLIGYDLQCQATTCGGACLTTAPPPVPDGTLATTPLQATKVSSTSLTTTWDVTSCTATDYDLIYGDLANVSTYALTGSKCAIGTSGSYSWTGVPAGNLYFLIVGTDGVSTESSWGTDSSGGERNGTNPSGQCGMTTKDTSATCP